MVVMVCWRQMVKLSPHRPFEINSAPTHPSISVCLASPQIQSQEGVDRLTRCLEGILASTYQKLEVIVLEDVAHTQVSQHIRYFAHQGVRFVFGGLGDEVRQRLFEEASGHYVLLMDIDTRLKPETIEQLVEALTPRQELQLTDQLAGA